MCHGDLSRGHYGKGSEHRWQAVASGAPRPNIVWVHEDMIYGYMADVDRRLRGKGYPESVELRSVENEIHRMNRFLEERILAEIEMWHPKPWHQEWYERNKFWVWLIGAIVSVGGIVAKILNVF